MVYIKDWKKEYHKKEYHIQYHLGITYFIIDLRILNVLYYSSK